MPTNRRTILAASGAALALFAAGGVWRVMRAPERATDPWNARSAMEPDVRLDAFRHAILAPNPHNRQPWLIRLEGSNGATLFCDLDRRLPMTDPFDRQITIGFGCFAELARIAAARRGVRLETSWFPDGEPQPRLDGRPVARMRFVADPELRPDPLFATIAKRRSTKTVFEDRPVAPERLRQLADVVALSEDAWHVVATEDNPSRVAAIRTLVLEAVAIEMHTPRVHQESVELMRIGATEVDANPDGVALTGPGIEAMGVGGLISRTTLADPGSIAFRQGEAMMAEIYGSTPAFLSVTTAGNGRAHQVLAGKLYARANLIATDIGLAMHPMSQSLQEYPEMAGVFGQMQTLLRPVFAHGIAGDIPPNSGHVQMLARIGHGPPVAPTPRWPLETRLA